MLKAKGKTVVHILNFKKILFTSERIISISEKDNAYYIRFYDFMDELINFNILTFNKNNINDRKLITTKLYPHIPEDLKKYFVDAGFKSVNFYSSLNKDKFIPDESKDLIITAEK